MSPTPLIVLTIGAFGILPLATHAATIHGYVVDADGRRVQGARVQAWRMVPTDQQPPQRPKRLAETTTDSRGNFALSVDTRKVNMIIASFDDQSGAASPSFTANVRVALRHNRPRPVEKEEKGRKRRGQISTFNIVEMILLGRRPLRVEFEDAMYHLCARGNARQRIFRD